MKSIVVNDPHIISLVDAVRRGAVPLTELKNKIGRYPLEQGITKSTNISLIIKDYFDDPLKHEWEFIKKCFNKHDGKERVHIKLGLGIEVRKISKTCMVIEIKDNGAKIDSK